MAVTSGTVCTGTLKHSYFYCNWQQVSQSTSGNYTDINWQVGLNCGTSSGWDAWYSNAIRINSLYINGSNVCSGTYSNISGAGDHEIASGTARIYHDTNGGKTFNINLSGWLYTYGDTTGSVDFTLNTIPRYANITSFSVSQRDETSVKFSYSVDATCDYAWYSTNNGSSWAGLPNSGIVSGLSANTTYNFKLRVRRKDSQLTTTSGTKQQTTYNYPYIKSSSNFTIGNNIPINIYNPLGRTLNLYFYGNDNSLICNATRTNNGSTEIGNNASEIDSQYASIPNSNEGSYKVRVVCSALSRDTTVNGAKYYTNTAECSPTFSNFTYKDSNTDVVNVTENNQVFVKGYSKLFVTVPVADKMTTQKYATPSSYSISCDTLNASIQYNDESDVSTEVGTILNSGALRVNVRAYDSRTNSALAYKDITVLDYSKPVINLSATRLNKFENETTIKISGTYTKLTVNNTDKNTITNVKYRYRETSGTWSNWTNVNTTVVNGNYTCTDVILSLDNTKSFEFEIQVTDRIDSNTNTTNVDVGQAVFFVSSNKRACYINGQEILTYDVVDTW